MRLERIMKEAVVDGGEGRVETRGRRPLGMERKTTADWNEESEEEEEESVDDEGDEGDEIRGEGEEGHEGSEQDGVYD